MNKQQLSLLKRSTILVFFVAVLAPVTTFAQRRWVTHRNRVVIYQSRPYVTYQPRPRYRTYTYRTSTYGYPQSYYSTYYSNGYGYTEPYYASPYYAYRYTQPYYVNQNSYVTPNYRYYDNGYYRRHRRSGLRLRFSWR